MKWKVNPKYIEITPTLRLLFCKFGKKFKSVSTVQELREMSTDKKFLPFFDEKQQVYVIVDYEHFTLTIEKIPDCEVK
ncbi:hypothetical protein J9303_12195 [Bacillaceae bacterium Marseille-Q3522]|nr:hypothetical protein [Bacillaceae bacterium Marseille-Q3522]